MFDKPTDFSPLFLCLSLKKCAFYDIINVAFLYYQIQWFFSLIKQIFHFFGGTTHDGRRKEDWDGDKAGTKQL